jgi:hypothetical protein
MKVNTARTQLLRCKLVTSQTEAPMSAAALLHII